MMKRFFLLLAGMLLLSGTVFADEAPPPLSVQDMTAESAILINARTGEVLYERHADELAYPASMTKMMTCILAIESGQLSRTAEVMPEDTEVECTRLQAGEEIRLQELITQMMMISDNGAALTVGRTLGGSIEGFAAMMNAKAKSLGMQHTHFVNPNGMPDDGHYSTARDMARLAAYGMKNPQFRQIVGTTEKRIYYIQPAGYTTYCENSNELLYSYPGCTGIKTGWTTEAGGCLTAAAQRDGTELIAVVMHASDEETRFVDAAALLDYGFSYFRQGSRQG